MNKELHTVTIPMSDYNELLEANKNAEEKISSNVEYVAKLNLRSREFVSALAFLEEKGLLDEFNSKISKSYKLQSVGINKDYKQLVES